MVIIQIIFLVLFLFIPIYICILKIKKIRKKIIYIRSKINKIEQNEVD